MRNVVGQIASKEDFYERKRELRRLFRALEAGANIQLSAPRRVGKSSILYFLKDNPFDGYHFVYVEVESARTTNEFYRKIYREILKCESLIQKRNFWDQLNAKKNNFLKRLKGFSLGPLGSIEFNEAAEIDYEEELLNLLSGVDLEQSKLVILVDEFPEVILNIVIDNKGDVTNAKSFLQSNRAFRNHGDIRLKVQFIYAGSNSLNITAANLDSSVLINDLNSVPVFPLEPEEGSDLVKKVLANYGYEIGEQELRHLIEKVEWLIPFHLQLMIQEIISQIDPGEKITNEIIDKGFASILNQRNDHHFEHYVKRLKRLFQEDELKFVKIFLCQLANNPKVSKNQTIDIANGLISEAQMRKTISSLMHDGYLLSADNEEEYKFNSPILKNWWRNHEC